MIQRHITTNLLAALADTPVVLLNGARQTGKSTLVQSLLKGPHPARYFTLDDVSVLAAARNDPVGFLASQKGAVVIDEVQRAPELFMAIKTEVDRDRRPGRFLLTGSTNVMLLPTLSDSLAGRMEVLTLWPFSQGELAGRFETFVDSVFANAPLAYTPPTEAREGFFGRIIRGGYPEAVSRMADSRRRAWFGSYLTTILHRDVRDLANIEGLTVMPQLLALLATRATNLLNYAEISRTAAIPQSTLKRYMTLLEATYLIRHFPSWSGNLGKRLVKTAKLIMSDTGLMANQLGVNTERMLTDVIRGPLLENFVAMELCKQVAWSQTIPRLFHYRTPAGHEVDVVLEDAAGRVVGVEVKASSRVTSADFAGLRHLAEVTGKRFVRGVVLYTGGQDIPFAKNLSALPIDSLWRMK